MNVKNIMEFLKEFLKESFKIIDKAWYFANPLERAILIFGIIVAILGIITLIVKG